MVTLAPGIHRFRLELWDHAGPARQAIVGQSLSLERSSVLGGEGTFRGELGLEDPALDYLTRGTIFRLYDQIEDEATLWRYTGQTKIRTQTNALRMELRGDALWMDLRQGMVRSVQADGRTLTTFGLFGLLPSEWLTEFILPGYDGDAVSFVLGTVDPTTPVNLEFDDDSPLSALRKLEQETECEAEFVPNAAGDTYTLHLRTRIGKTAELVELRYRKNLQGVKRTEEEVDPASRLYAHGAHGLTLGDAVWEVGGIAGSDISFAGEHPVFEDDAFVDLWFYAGGTAYQVTASDATAGTLTLDSVVGLNVGDVGWLASAADGTRLMYLESPSSRADIGIKVGTFTREDIPNVSNLLANGDLVAWTAGSPDAWSSLGAPVVAEETSPVYGQHGSRSAHVTAAAADEGLISDAIDITADDREPYHSILAGLTLVSGRVRMELRHSNGQIYPLEERAQVAAIDVYTTLKSYPVSTEPLPVGTAQLAIVAHEGAAEFYLDAAMVTRSVGEIEPEFLVGSGAHALWQATADELAELAIPRVEYEVDIADLGLADPDRYPWERLNLGDDVKLRDPDIGNVTLRVVELSQDVLNVRATRVVVAPGPWSRPNDPFRPGRRTQAARTPAPGSVAESKRKTVEDVYATPPAPLQLADPFGKVGASGSLVLPGVVQGDAYEVNDPVSVIGAGWRSGFKGTGGANRILTLRNLAGTRTLMLAFFEVDGNDGGAEGDALLQGNDGNFLFLALLIHDSDDDSAANGMNGINVASPISPATAQIVACRFERLSKAPINITGNTSGAVVVANLTEGGTTVFNLAPSLQINEASEIVAGLNLFRGAEGNGIVVDSSSHATDHLILLGDLVINPGRGSSTGHGIQDLATVLAARGMTLGGMRFVYKTAPGAKSHGALLRGRTGYNVHGSTVDRASGSGFYFRDADEFNLVGCDVLEVGDGAGGADSLIVIHDSTNGLVTGCRGKKGANTNYLASILGTCSHIEIKANQFDGWGVDAINFGSTFPADSYIEIPFDVTTTDDTVTRILLAPMHDDQVLTAEVELQAIGTTNYRIAKDIGSVIMRAGSTTWVEGAATAIHEQESVAGMFSEVSSSATGLRYRIQGLVGETIQWRGVIRLRSTG